MKDSVEVEEINKVQKRIKVVLSEDKVREAFDKTYKQVRKKARIQGFRPGKAPLHMIKKLYGGSIAVDVADVLVRSHLFEAIKEKDLSPISAPVLETAELPAEGQTYTIQAVIDIMPEFEVNGYKGLQLAYKPTKVDGATVEKEVEAIRRRQAKRKELPEGEESKKGHVVTFSQKGFHQGGQEAWPILDTGSIPAELGARQLLPEVDEGLVGLKAGETKTIGITFPADYGQEELAGKPAELHITIEKIEEMILPEADDELAKDLGLESLNELQNNIRDYMERQAEQSRRQQLEGSLLQQLNEKNQIDVPPSIVDQVIDSMIDEQHFQDEKEKKSAKSSKEYRNNLLDSARDRARNTLILHQIIETEKLEVSDEDLDKHARSMIQGQAGGDDIDEKMLETIKKSLGDRGKENLLFTKALDFVIENATISEIDN